MRTFALPVSRYMTTNLEVAQADADLAGVARRLDERRISALPIVDSAGVVVGVISRSDLLKIGRRAAGSHRGAAAMILPERRVSELPSREPVVCTSETTLRDAARTMIEHRIHRLFVVDDRRLVGVISTLDLTRAVQDARLVTPLREIMSTPILSVRAVQPISVAIEQLDRAHVTGLVVVEEDWPIGVFTQEQALHARDLPRDTAVDDLYEAAIICLPGGTRVHRAAAHVARLDVRRVIVCEHREAVGVVTGLDFAALVAA